ncbi:hypothetical protein LCGC14_0943680 [marine sediment metagenome]|uniref:Uncharacterized protein n=2 Tax=root TaxID=1 RepID=A0A831QNI5_9FLAO|nr:hypothetical protein [Pricia antarctica]
MPTIIDAIAEVKKHVAVNRNLDWSSVEPYVKQAERKYIKSLIGRTMYDSYSQAEPEDPVALEVYNLLEEASANLAWFLYLPMANVQISDSGIAVSESEYSKAAEWWQIRDLRRSFIDAGFTALDEALKIMEQTEGETFAAWKASEGYTIFRELFVDRTDTFNRWFNISNSRKTFLALRPYMLEVHHQFFTAKLNLATIELLNNTVKPAEGTETDAPEYIQYMALQWLQAAQVNYTVYKAVHSGTFELTSNGIYEKIEEFPGYKVKPLGESQLHRVKDERLVAAEQYYKKAIALMEANPVAFPDYIKKDAAVFVMPMNTKSVVSF